LAMFRDRARGRRRCPRCWYDMSATPGLRCPECGKDARKDGRLFRTRRHWRRAGLAVLVMLAGGPIMLTPTIRPDGGRSPVPTIVLMLFCPDVDHESVYDAMQKKYVDHPVVAEFRRRTAVTALEPWQVRYLIEKAGVIRTRAMWPAGLPLRVDLNVP